VNSWPATYSYFPDLTAGAELNGYSLRPVQWTDREHIRQWRNAQLDVLRQVEPLTESDQDRYFAETVFPQFSQEKPAQFMFAFFEGNNLIGYGALVHIHWGDHRAEVSFLADPSRLNPTIFSSDWTTYLSLLKPIARSLGMHKLTTETYSLRSDLIPILEANGFVQEGVLREHHLVEKTFSDSHVHGFLL
jgi:RimJ/RimL family protein N-acetyltransferase